MVPGGICLAWAALLAYGVAPGPTKGLLKWVLPHLEGQGAIASMGLAMVGVGVGYFLSLIHHRLLFTGKRLVRWYHSDHTPFLRDAAEEGLLVICYRDGAHETVTLGEPEPVLSWRILTVLWHEQLGKSITKEMHEREHSLCDLAHGAGTCLVGVVLAFPLAVVLVVWGLWPPGWAFGHICWGEDAIRFGGAALVECVVVVLLWKSTSRLMQHAFRIPEIILWGVLKEQKAERETEPKAKAEPEASAKPGAKTGAVVFIDREDVV
jgi:hypothetical protein